MNGTYSVNVEVTRYDVSCLPRDHPERHNFMLTVEWRGPDSWAVVNRGYCYGRRSGQKSYESNPSSRTDRFKKAYRFTLDEALRIAQREAPKMQIGLETNPWTVEMMLTDPRWNQP